MQRIIVKDDKSHLIKLNSSKDQLVRASASGAADSALIPSPIKPIILTLVFTTSLLDAQHYRDSVENKPSGSRVVPLEKALAESLHLKLVDNWLAIFKQARYSPLIAFSR